MAAGGTSLDPGASRSLSPGRAPRRALGRRRPAAPWLAASALGLLGCTDLVPLEQPRREHVPCEQLNPERNLYFGDLHAHTSYSFDASSYGVRSMPADAYGFARGQQVELPPYDDAGRPTRSARLDRPLDFAALTDHGEFIGETYLCNTPGAPGYDSKTCLDYRQEVGAGATLFGFQTAFGNAERFADLCGADGSQCLAATRQRWEEIRSAADDAYDWSSACTFTTLIAYEYTNTLEIANWHRNVLFRTDAVPELPLTFYEHEDPMDLLRQLRQSCREADPDCDVLVIPHNSNLSNGNLFYPRYPGVDGPEAEADVARLRAEMEPLAEIFQHKGDMECRNGLDPAQANDPLCDFEKVRPPDDEVCEELPGGAGMRLGGCVHRLDFLRSVLLEGLREQARIGVNPYRLGFTASTDTHNATPGNVASQGFPGHVGLADDTPDKRLGAGTVTHDGIINNPGGLVGIWAEQNTREAIFDALYRKEVYATSGPRIALRLFAAWDLPADLCERSDRIAVAYDRGVPMGSALSGGPAGVSPTLFVRAERDAGSATHPGGLLDRVQIVKGWIDDAGQTHTAILEVAGDPASTASVSPSSCQPTGPGADVLCAVVADPDFLPSAPAFYYARVLENPSCRWSTYECNALGAAAPASCADPALAKAVRHRAWSSPIWYDP